MAAVDTAVLDAWLAERLLGWTYSAEGGEFPHWHPAGTYDCTVDPPALSTTGDGMLLVLEAMRARWATFNRKHWRVQECFAENLGFFEGYFNTDPDMSLLHIAETLAELTPLRVATAARAALEAE